MEHKRWYQVVFLSLPFWWIGLTTVYIFLQLIGSFSLAALLGFFVPIGIWNFAVSVTVSGSLYGFPLWLITFPLVLVTVFGGQRLLSKYHLNPVAQILVILTVLFLLTLAVDLIIWHRWASLEFYLTGGKVPPIE